MNSGKKGECERFFCFNFLSSRTVISNSDRSWLFSPLLLFKAAATAFFPIHSMVSILILGFGWTGDFLAELLNANEHQVSYASTTRDGRHDTIAWDLGSDPSAVDVSALPLAETVVVTFPVKDAQLMKALIDTYNKKISEANHPATHWIILSSTRPFSADTNDRHSSLDRVKDNNRVPSEEVALAYNGSVLHLAGLWGAQR